MEPLVSVIIPTYRRSVLLRRAIESVRRQTYGNVEILVVDDASRDDTEATVRSIADPRIRYICHPMNKGVSATRNTGIMEARGEYIALLDDDDRWCEAKLEKQVRALENYDAVLCTTIMQGIPTRVVWSERISLAHLRRGSFYPSGLMAKTGVLRDVMFDETLRVGEDWDLFIRIALRYRIGWLKDALVVYGDSEHRRTTNVGMFLSGQELEKRAAYLHKHRKFFGEFWFRRHLAVEYLPYIGSRSDKLQFLTDAVRRCGLGAVLIVMAYKTRWLIRKRLGRVFHAARWRMEV